MKRLAFLVAVVFVIASMVVISFAEKAEAIYVFEWVDDGYEWYFLDNDNLYTNENASVWSGVFIAPDDAVDIYEYGDYDFFECSLKSHIYFSLSGVTVNNNYFIATNLSENTTVFGPVYDGMLNANMGELDFTVENPSWTDNPISISKTDQDSWLIYNDRVFDESTSSWVDVTVNHSGMFIGRHIENPAPVPEPSTIVLSSIGLLIGAFIINKRRFKID